MAAMKRGCLKKTDMNRLLAELPEDTSFWAPVSVKRQDSHSAPGAEEVEFRELRDAADISYDHVNTRLSPKGIFFPQREVLCSFCKDTIRNVPLPEPHEKIIIFGLRPCDSTALLHLDRIFGKDAVKYEDPYYLARRSRSLLITLACNRVAGTCFCSSVGLGPSHTEGSDIIVFDLEDDLLFEAVTEKGAEFLAAYQHFFAEPDSAIDQKKSTLQEKMANLPVKYDISALEDRLEDIFTDPQWKAISDNCLGCGICTYLCPTCHCFDISDELKRDSGFRVRTWDSCQYPLFTKHASGHNPRGLKKARMQQRIMHKYSYSVKNYGVIFCVGCGRCIKYCPESRDIRTTLLSLKNTETEKKNR